MPNPCEACGDMTDHADVEVLDRCLAGMDGYELRPCKDFRQTYTRVTNTPIWHGPIRRHEVPPAYHLCPGELGMEMVKELIAAHWTIQPWVGGVRVYRAQNGELPFVKFGADITEIPLALVRAFHALRLERWKGGDDG